MVEEEKLFTQTEVNEIVEKRMGRVKRKEAKETYKQKYYELLRKSRLTDAGIPLEKVDQYVGYIDAEDEEEIEQQAHEIYERTKGKERSYVDPSGRRRAAWNPFK